MTDTSPSPQKKHEQYSAFGRLFSIPHDDSTLNEETWSQIQPCKTYRLGSKSIFITQPSSSFWVYFLGLVTCLLGGFLLIDHHEQLSRVWWGISLLLWGIGALIAGTSYQAFGYQLKCQGRKRVAWTSWWEVIYLIFQQVSVNAMLVGVAYSTLSPSGIQISLYVASLVSVAYVLFIAYGAFKPVKSFITFEMMCWWCTPFIVFMTLLNLWGFWQTGAALQLSLVGVWFGLYLTMYLYWLYYRADLTAKLWQKKRWFSENDVLHVALIIWIVYLAWVVEPLILDLMPSV